MKNSIREQIISSSRKLDDLNRSCKEVEGKIQRLQQHLTQLQQAVYKEEDRIRGLGVKPEEGNPQNHDYNLKLGKEKEELLRIIAERRKNSTTSPQKDDVGDNAILNAANSL